MSICAPAAPLLHDESMLCVCVRDELVIPLRSHEPGKCPLLSKEELCTSMQMCLPTTTLSQNDEENMTKQNRMPEPQCTPCCRSVNLLWESPAVVQEWAAEPEDAI